MHLQEVERDAEAASDARQQIDRMILDKVGPLRLCGRAVHVHSGRLDRAQRPPPGTAARMRASLLRPGRACRRARGSPRLVCLLQPAAAEAALVGVYQKYRPRQPAPAVRVTPGVLPQRQVTEHTALTMTAEKLEKQTTVGNEPQKRYGIPPPSLWTQVAVSQALGPLALGGVLGAGQAFGQGGTRGWPALLLSSPRVGQISGGRRRLTHLGTAGSDPTAWPASPHSP